MGAWARAILLHERCGTTPMSPPADFDEDGYLNSNPDVAAAVHAGQLSCGFAHYALYGRKEGRRRPRRVGSAERGLAGEVAAFVRRGPAFEEFSPRRTGRPAAGAKVIAFYLPQFHAFAENDAWWGTGFTEWSNLSRGLPRIRGHYQPRIPRDLGFYNLTHPDTIRRQVEMAQAAGVSGFCFYFYWFNGKRLLDAPLDLFVKDESIGFPFCLMWANENWTRRWDGQEHEVLMAQDYDPQHDAALIACLSRYFEHARYIRLDGRPLFIIYRPDQLPDAAARIARWRTLWRTHHHVEPLLFMAQCWGLDPSDWGLDGAVEFPPHQMSARCPAVVPRTDEVFDPACTTRFYSYEDLVAAAFNGDAPTFPLVKTVSPSWDNDARRQGLGATTFLGSTPALYESWLRSAIRFAQRNPVGGEHLVFVNAWNEWGEGAYLEPDIHFGAAYLNATARAIYGISDAKTARKLLLVGHDAFPAGAQAILLAIARTLSRQFGLKTTLLLLDGGQLQSDYQAVCRTVILPGDAEGRDALLSQLVSEGYDTAITNTIVSGELSEHLAAAGVHFISLVHELPQLVAERRLEPQARLIANHAQTVVVPHNIVRDGFLRIVPTCAAPLVVLPQGMYNMCRPGPNARSDLRRKLGLAPDATIVLNVGYGDLRKGFDLFVAAAAEAASIGSNVHFVWLGNLAPEAEHWFLPTADEPNLHGFFHHHPFVGDPAGVMNVIGGADLFFLSSREDPFPTVVLEAYAAGLDIVAFAGCGGFADLVAANGRLLDSRATRSTALAILKMISEVTPESIAAKAVSRRTVIENDFAYDSYCASLLRLLDPQLRRVSVVVPNYNYGRHLYARLTSIFAQTYPVFEVIVLDDASNDDSIAVIRRVSAETGRDVRLVVNAENSGSAFRQWRKGVELARGEYLWIAEADDTSDPAFLGTLMESIVEHEAVFGFTDSWQMDESGSRIGDSYADYADSTPAARFRNNFVLQGRTFASDHLAIKNTILNVSAVVWRRDSLIEAFTTVGDTLYNYRIAGDWRLYLAAALTDAPVAYVARSLNGHRRHTQSLTHALDKQRHLDEIINLHRIAEQTLLLEPTQIEAMREYERQIGHQFSLSSRDERILSDA